MSIFDKIRGEFIDIIEWLDETQDTIVYRYERYDNEIKNGAQLIVRESQAAVLVDQGQIADVFAPGRHELKTENMPILSKLRGWKYGFESPFKVEVYFVNTKRFTDLKWGTANPVMMRDADLGVVRVRAFGSYAMRVADPGKFLQEIAGTDWHFTTDEIAEHLRNQIVARFGEACAAARIPVFDLSANYSKLGDSLVTTLQPGMSEIGVELLNFNIENVSLPPEVEEMIDKRSSMGVVGDLNRFTQFQAADALEKAASNPSGMGAAGVGIGLGAAMTQQAMAQSADPQATPPPVPTAKVWYIAVNGQQQGPFTPEQLAPMVGQTLGRETLVWTAGMAAWEPAHSVPELANILGSVPPPIPGA